MSDTGRFQANRITLSATTREKVVAAGSWTGFRVVQECKRSTLWAIPEVGDL